ncbi:TatC subunit of twin-arginine targeting system [Candidatus Nitrososphaera gargensis Ga9.2]|uniref:Sec-independent protein translocase protein TatC n=1 Tax=Nitrososphaera gargensis (strain Ga9.2) TaxID=1237085 RepID=K0IKB4_NITGG|nr:twin-arginine translocase subunit TatC [Candidatus Nitrososphaera gargensis]AFU59668.1 TatC subunit of twin-arginine targeting system [Candidatus Nitrososphaera gargensis Ga9.2]
MAAGMTIREHIEELRTRVFRVALSIIIITVFAMTFDLRPVEVAGLPLAYPYPDPIHNISTRLTFYMQDTLLPEGVGLIQTAPGQAFFAQIYVSALIGLIASIPIIVREISAFISPAISTKTKIGVLNIFLPAVALFVTGLVFSYFVVIPFTLNFLYQYGEALNVATFLTINDFISFVMQFFLGFGVAFQLPIVMYGISMTDAVSPRFWRDNFRYAALILVIFGAIITPDGSGVTMWFVAGPMLVLYAAGMLVVERRAAVKTNT